MKRESNDKAILSSNPLGEEMLVEVAMPKSFKIKMVEASKLSDFKIWSGIASILANIFVGFLVAAITNIEPKTQKLLWFVSVIFGFLALAAFGMVLWVNKKMEAQKNIINMKASKE